MAQCKDLGQKSFGPTKNSSLQRVLSSVDQIHFLIDFTFLLRHGNPSPTHVAFLSVTIFAPLRPSAPLLPVFCAQWMFLREKKRIQLKLCATVTISPQFVSLIWIYILGNPEGKHQSGGGDSAGHRRVCSCTLLIWEADCKRACRCAANVVNAVETKTFVSEVRSMALVLSFLSSNLFHVLLAKMESITSLRSTLNVLRREAKLVRPQSRCSWLRVAIQKHKIIDLADVCQVQKNKMGERKEVGHFQFSVCFSLSFLFLSFLRFDSNVGLWFVFC